MKAILFIGLAMLLSCQQPAVKKEKEVASSQQMLRTNGRELLDPNGQRIILKGTNLGNWLVPEGYMFKMGEVNAPRKIDELLYELIGPDSLMSFWHNFLENYITEQDIVYLKAIGCNHIRLPFHYKLFTDETYMGKRNAGFEYFDKVIEWCRKEQLYVLLDMHCAPGGQTGDNIDDSYGYPFLLKSTTSQALMSDIWVSIARKYKNEPIVIGYDLVNEPIAHYFNDELDSLNHQLFLLYKRLIKDIRVVDQQHAIFLNGSVWSTNFDVFEEILDSNVVYEFHKYWMPTEQKEIQQYVDFSNKHAVPIYIGETGENTDEWVADFRELLDNNGIHWAFWPYKKMNNTRGIMNFDQPEFYQLISDYAGSDRSSYKEMRENRPDIEKIQQALNAFNENAHFEKCFQNKGYSAALNLKTEVQ